MVEAEISKNREGRNGPFYGKVINIMKGEEKDAWFISAENDWTRKMKELYDGKDKEKVISTLGEIIINNNEKIPQRAQAINFASANGIFKLTPAIRSLNKETVSDIFIKKEVENFNSMLTITLSGIINNDKKFPKEAVEEARDYVEKYSIPITLP